MLRCLDTFSRYIWLWILPVIIFPILFTLLVLSRTTYTASASLWVEQPIFSASTSINGNSYDTPAKQMSSMLSELLNTRDFVNNIIDTTGWHNQIRTDTDRINAFNDIVARTNVNGDKYRLITLTYTNGKSSLAVETLNAIITQFQNYYSSRIKNQGDAATTYYQQLANSTKADLDTATTQVQKFLDDHPNQVTKDSTTNVSTPEDLLYNNLLQNLDAARKRNDDAKTNLQQVLTNYGAYQQGQTTTLNIQDKPAVLDNGTGKIREIGIGAGIGLVVALVFCALVTIFLTLLDNTFRYTYHARQLLKRERILEIPNYRRTKRNRKNLLMGPGVDHDFEEGSETPFLVRILTFKPNLKAGVDLRHSLAAQITVEQQITE